MLPTAEDFPPSARKGAGRVEDLFASVKAAAGMAEWPCELQAGAGDRPAHVGAGLLLRHEGAAAPCGTFTVDDGGAAVDFGHVKFPGDRRNCEHCHVEDQYTLPLPDGLLPSRWSDIDSTRARVESYYMGPTATACAGCHDADATMVHGLTMSLITGDPPSFQESCASCHAERATFGIDRAHAWLGDE